MRCRLTDLVLQVGTGAEVGWGCEAGEGWTAVGQAAPGAQAGQAGQVGQADLASGGAGWVTAGASEDVEAWTEAASVAPRGGDLPWAAEAAEGWARPARWT